MRPQVDPRRFPRPRAFTLIELLVVVGIIVLLAGLLLPMLYKTYRSASKTRLAADLNTIATALDVYKNDFGDYPRVPSPGTGFAILGQALIGPFDSTPDKLQFSPFPPNAPYKPGTVAWTGSAPNFVQWVALRETSAAPAVPDWGRCPFADGADGPGFRTRYDPTRGISSKIVSPYLPVDKFKRQGLALLDHNGNPIMYFPASAVKTNLNVTGSIYIGVTPAPGAAPPAFNFDDNGTLALSTSTDVAPSMTKTIARMQAMMGLRGDYLAGGAKAGQLQPGLTPVTKGFLLWSAGADGIFGPLEDVTSFANDQSLMDRAVGKCDDVANIPLPQ